MLFNYIISQEFSVEKLIRTLESMKNLERIAFLPYSTDRLIIQSTTRFLFDDRYIRTDKFDINYYDIIAELHPTQQAIKFSHNQSKTISDDKNTHRSAMQCAGNAYLISTLCKKYQSQANGQISLSISNNILLPSNEIVATASNPPNFRSNITGPQSAILVRSLPVSRIDPLAAPHRNVFYKLYNDTKERSLAVKYMTAFDKSADIPTPHFHFNTLNQSRILRTEYSANAIHVDKLRQYLRDLYSTYTSFTKKFGEEEIDLNNIKIPSILKYDLGMPFFDIILGKLCISNDAIQEFATTCNNKNLIKLMNSLSTVKHANPNGGLKQIEAIFADITLYREFIEENPNDTEAIALLTECINTVINLSNEKTYNFTDNNELNR
ncbi:MAG: hypothetical protein IKC49_00030 [Clostridia bacterium]|nr:hypothetical protein [Clostridia bacterium]